MNHSNFLVVSFNTIYLKKVKTYWNCCCEFEYGLTEEDRNILKFFFVFDYDSTEKDSNIGC